MKTLVSCIAILLLFLIPSEVLSQYIAIQEDEKVEIRNIKGGYITSGFYNGIKEIAQGDSFVVLWYESGKVEIRNYELKFLTTAYYSNLNHIGASKEWLVLHYDNGKIEIRDKDLKYYNSWFK